MRAAPIDGLPAAPGRDGRTLFMMWLGFSAVVFWAGELLRALQLAQGGGVAAAAAALRLLAPYVMWLLALAVEITVVALRTLPRAVVIDVADLELASFLSMAALAGVLLRALAEVEADDEGLLVDTVAVTRLVGVYAIFLLAVVATVMPVVVGLPRRAIPSATFVLLSAVIWYHLQLWLP